MFHLCPRCHQWFFFFFFKQFCYLVFWKFLGKFDYFLSQIFPLLLKFDLVSRCQTIFFMQLGMLIKSKSYIVFKNSVSRTHNNAHKFLPRISLRRPVLFSEVWVTLLAMAYRLAQFCYSMTGLFTVRCRTDIVRRLSYPC